MINVVSHKSQIEYLITIFVDLALLLGINTESDVPEWFNNSGDQWPIFIAAKNIQEQTASPQLSDALSMMKTVPADTSKSRWQSFEKLLIGDGCEILWLNESKYINGRIPSPSTFKVKALYQKVGLEVIGSELPDHASIELTFLAYLAEQQLQDHGIDSPWRVAYKLFSKKHIKPWLPKVGSRLTSQTDPAWIAIGMLLQAILFLPVNAPQQINILHGIPTIQNTEKCSLCGFCTQVCPSKALQIIETKSSTALWIAENLCTHCTKCENICPEKIISLNDNIEGKMTKILVESPRVECSKCGQMMISKAELDYTAAILGNPDWLWICLDCRK